MNFEPLNVERSKLSVERSAPGAASSALGAANPWPGLAPFTEDQSRFFYGRDEEIRALTRLMERKALTVLFGQSGLGKSSLLQAGVFPRLRTANFCPIYIRLDHNEGAPSPTQQVKTMVAAESARAGTWTKPGSAQPGETLWEFFHHRDDRLVDGHGRTIVPVLVFDQFEELFTLGAAAGAQRDRAVKFMGELAELVENRPSEQLVERLDRSSDEMEAFDFSRTDYRVCISLREDYLPHLEGLKTIMPALMENRMRLTQMSGTQALDAVVKPGGALVTEEVARAIVEFVSGARGGSVERLAELQVEPPLLSVICHELNERRRSLGQSQITADLVTGNRREILTDFYERSVSDLPEGMRRFVEDRLLTKSGFRDNLALETALEEPGVTKPLIDTLVSRRLLRIEDRIGTQRVELTHDVLADVVRASRDARQQRIALEQAKEREQRAVAEGARRTRRMRIAIGGLAAAVVALSIGALFGIRAQRRATAQASRGDLLLGSRLLDDGKLTDGLAYLVSAARKDPTNRVLAPRILAALTSHNFVLPMGAPLALPSPGLNGHYSADGKRIFVQSEDGTVRLIDAAEWKIEREVTFNEKIRRGGVTTAEKNSEVFAVVLADNTLLVVNAATGAPQSPRITPPERIAGRTPTFALSPDGRWLAASSGLNVWLWDVASAELRATIPGGSSYYRGFAFSPDSRRIVTTHGARARITQLWSVPDGSPIGNPVVDEAAGMVIYHKFSADGRRLLVWFTGGWLVCDTDTGLPVRPLFQASASSLDEVYLTPDGRRLVQINSNRVFVLDVSTGSPVFPPLVHTGQVFAAAFADDGRILFTNSVDGLFRLWDLETGRILAEPTFKQEQYTPAAVAPDGRRVALFSASGAVYPLRLGRGAAAPLVLPRHAAIRMASFVPTPPARLLMFTTTQAKAIDVASGREAPGGFNFPQPVPTFAGGANRSRYGGTTGPGLTLFVQPQPGIWRAWTLGENGIAHDVLLADIPPGVTGFTNATRNLVPATGRGSESNTVGIWNIHTGQRVTSIKADGAVRSPGSLTVLSPDETRVAFQTATDQVVHVCDVASGKESFAVQLSGKESIDAFRFSPSGGQLLTGGDWGGVQVWDGATGKLLRSSQGHRTNVIRFDFSTDGRYYVSVSGDGSVQVWDAASHDPVGPPLVQTGAAARADFSPDNTRIVTPSVGGTARIWDVGTGLPLTGAMDHDGVAVTVVAYSPDGQFVTTQAAGGGVKNPAQRLWAAPPDGNGAKTPGWLLRLATICVGQRLTEQGKLVIAAEEMANLDDLRRELAALPDDAPYLSWAKWFLSEAPDRPIAPGFTITPIEARKLAAEMTREQTQFESQSSAQRL